MSTFLKHKEITLKQTDYIINKILTEQKNQNLNLSYPKDKLNILMMIISKHFRFKTQDLIFSTTLKLFEDKKVWKTIREKNINFEQLIGVNEHALALLAYLMTKYSRLDITKLDTNTIYLDIVLLNNTQNIFTGENLEFLNNVIVPYLNILIFYIGQDNKELTRYFSTLNDYLNSLIIKSNNSDYIYILYSILEHFKVKKIVKIEF